MPRVLVLAAAAALGGAPLAQPALLTPAIDAAAGVVVGDALYAPASTQGDLQPELYRLEDGRATQVAIAGEAPVHIAALWHVGDATLAAVTYTDEPYPLEVVRFDPAARRFARLPGRPTLDGSATFENTTGMGAHGLAIVWQGTPEEGRRVLATVARDGALRVLDGLPDGWTPRHACALDGTVYVVAGDDTDAKRLYAVRDGRLAPAAILPPEADGLNLTLAGGDDGPLWIAGTDGDRDSRLWRLEAGATRAALVRRLPQADINEMGPLFAFGDAYYFTFYDAEADALRLMRGEGDAVPQPVAVELEHPQYFFHPKDLHADAEALYVWSRAEGDPDNSFTSLYRVDGATGDVRRVGEARTEAEKAATRARGEAVGGRPEHPFVVVEGRVYFLHADADYTYATGVLRIDD